MKSGNEPYSITGAPDPGSGISIPDGNQLKEICRDPKVQAGIDRIEKRCFNGKPSVVKMMFRNEARRHYYMDSLTKFNKGVIDIARRKEKGTY